MSKWIKYNVSQTCKLCFLFIALNLIARNDSIAQTEFYNPDKIQGITLSINQENWSDILDSLRLFGNGLLLADVSIGNQEYKNVGLRYGERRGFEKGRDRNPLYIKLNYIHRQQSINGITDVYLSDIIRDPSMIREVLGQEIIRKYINGLGANFAEVKINDKDYGLMVNFECLNNNYLSRHKDLNNATLVRATPPSIRENKDGCRKKEYASLSQEQDIACYTSNYQLLSNEGWDDLIELTKTLGEAIDDIESILNVDAVLWMLAINNVLVNLDSYSGAKSQNYYLYKDHEGIFQPIIGSMNYAFGTYKNSGLGSDMNLDELQHMDPLLHYNNQNKPLIQQILSVPKYQKRYLSHIRTIVYEEFLNDSAKKRAEQLQYLINLKVLNEKNKYYNTKSFQRSLTETIGKNSKVPGIFELMDIRSKFIKKHKLFRVIPVEFEQVDVRSKKEKDKSDIDNFRISAKLSKRATSATLYYRFDQTSAYKAMAMLDNGQFPDKKSGDKIFYALVLPNKEETKIEYYIEAQNAVISSFYPSNYQHTGLITSLDELNQ